MFDLYHWILTLALEEWLLFITTVLNFTLLNLLQFGFQPMNGRRENLKNWLQFRY